jgi:23S rRNA pseudouridine2457 synthase
MSTLVIFNKPFQVLSQFSNMDGKKSLKDFLGTEKAIENCYPAGRLDYDSEGLLLLTDNGQLQHRISHPSQKLEKTYLVQVEGLPKESDLSKIRSGISLKDGACKPAKIQVVATPKLWQREPPIRKRPNDVTTWLEISISEGRNRQVRRMTAAIGFPCLRLVRTKIGEWSIDDLSVGEFKIINIHLPARSKQKKQYSNTQKNQTIL